MKRWLLYIGRVARPQSALIFESLVSGAVDRHAGRGPARRWSEPDDWVARCVFGRPPWARNCVTTDAVELSPSALIGAADIPARRCQWIVGHCTRTHHTHTTCHFWGHLHIPPRVGVAVDPSVYYNWILLVHLKGQLCFGCRRQSSCRPPCHISKTKQDRPIVTMEHFGTNDLCRIQILLLPLLRL